MIIFLTQMDKRIGIPHETPLADRRITHRMPYDKV